ncbi:MAG: BLUF domain-containing protein [Sphingobacteriaceae bacterium]|nr:BLUF domain-containing protein [Sphingobacteriaceae bacterium]
MNAHSRPFFALIFVSSVTEILSKEEVSVIVEAERKQSNSNGLSGMAIVLGGNVLRYVEGNEENVIAEFKQASRNYNITNIIKLFDGSIAHRYFENYLFMSNVHPSLSDFKSPEMKEYLEECLSIDSMPMRIIKDFIKNNT